MTNAALIAKLVEAPKGSRELDAAIQKTIPPYTDVSYVVESDGWVVNGKTGIKAPHYTTNLQDAVDLVPEGWLWRLDGTNPAHPEADLWGPNWRTEREQEYISCGAKTPALALAIAILKAMETESAGKTGENHE